MLNSLLLRTKPMLAMNITPRSFRQLERLVRTHAIFPPLPRMKRCFSDYYRSVNWYFVSLYVILQCLECLRQYIEYLQ